MHKLVDARNLCGVNKAVFDLANSLATHLLTQEVANGIFGVLFASLLQIFFDGRRQQRRRSSLQRSEVSIVSGPESRGGSEFFGIVSELSTC